MLLESAVTMLTNALGGSAIGAITGAVGKKIETDAETKRLALEKEITKINNDHELELARIRGGQTVQQADIESRMAEMQAAYSAMVKSYAHDQATYANVDSSKASGWLIAVDFVRGIMRPAVTGFLVGSSVALAAYFMAVYNVQFTQEQAYQIVMMLVTNLTTCTGVAIAWYFAARSHSQSRNKE